MQQNVPITEKITISGDLLLVRPIDYIVHGMLL